jgi:hypothetical protein
VITVFHPHTGMAHAVMLHAAVAHPVHHAAKGVEGLLLLGAEHGVEAPNRVGVTLKRA